MNLKKRIKKRAFVPGGSGFIGGHLIKSLEKKGYQTAIYDLKKPNGFTFKGKLYLGDVLNHQGLRKAVAEFKPGIIFDCSGILGTSETFAHIQKTVDVNIKGTLNILEIAKETKTPLIYFSLTNNWLNPYTITKRAATRFCLMYSREYKVKVAILKGLNVYGPRQHWQPVKKYAPVFITCALENKPLVINDLGSQIMDAVHVADICEMMIRMYKMETCWGKEIDGGTGIPMTVNETAQKIIKLAKSQSIIKHRKQRCGEPKDAVSLADPAPARQLLDYYPKIAFDKGMKKTIDWYRKNYRKFEKSPRPYETRGV